MRQLELERPGAEQRAAAPAAVLTGLGTALPPTAVSNAQIAQYLGVDEEWIVRRTGIESRRHLGAGERLLELAAAAGAAALDEAAVAADAIDLVLVATSAGDQLLPALSPQVAAALGIPGAGAIDLGAACSGFVAGLGVGAAAVESRRANAVLLIGADGLSRHVDPLDRKTAAVFGDGAGAAVVAASTAGAGGVGPVLLGSDGGQADLIGARHRGMIWMDGHATFVQAVRRLCEVTPQAAAAAECSLSEVDLFVFHQANRRILRAVAERLELPREKVVDAIARVGNTSAASIPLALADARAEGRLRPGMRVLLAAVGAGFTWGATVVEWTA